MLHVDLQDGLPLAAKAPAGSLGTQMTAARQGSQSGAQVDSPAHASNVHVSSRTLGWTGLNYERRDYRPSSRALPPAGSSQHLIFVSLTSGHIVCESDGVRGEHELSPGCVAVLPAGTSMSWHWSTPVSFSVLRLEPALLDRVARSVFGLEPHDYRLTRAERRIDTAITNIAGVLAREVVHADPGSRLYAESLASILAVHLLRQYAHSTDGDPLVRYPALPEATLQAPAQVVRSNGLQPRPISDALAFIHTNYARELSLKDIAQAAHLSSFHLARVFKQALGVSPHQYLIQLRVSSARWLLAAGSGERSLAEVAVAVGFADQSHLTRHFKRVIGTTPRRFQARQSHAPVAAPG